MKKKIGIIIAILLCVVLVFTFVACGNKDATDDGTGDGGSNGSGSSSGSSSGSGGSGSSSDKLTVDASNQAAVKDKIEAYIDSWLKINAQEEHMVSDQKKSLKTDLLNDAQRDEFYLLSTTRKQVKYSDVRVTFDGDEEGGAYNITVSYTDTRLSAPISFSFQNKAAQVLEYAPWSGTKLQDAWVSESKTAFKMIDPLLAAGIKMVNEVTGNSVTGKFGADGVIGLSVGGKKYGLRVKGNIDLTKKGTVVGKDENQNDVVNYAYDNKASNEVGLVVVNGDGDEIFGIFYDAAATAEANKLYIMYSKTGADGKLERDASNQVIHYYKYINYVDILGYIEGLIPNTFSEANGGVLTFKDKTTNAPIEVNGLTSLLTALDAKPGIDTIVELAANLVAKAYENEGNVYIDINLGAVVSKISTILPDLSHPLLDEMNIQIANLSGLLGHITIGGKIDQTTGMLTGFELSVNIPKCEFKLNNYPEGDSRRHVIPVPAISFSIYMDDFSFLKTGTVQNVIPADAKTNAEYFSPTNVDLSGNLYIKHEETDKDPYEATFHFDLATDINPFEIVANGEDSTARAALVIKRSVGDEYDEETAANFFSISYEQATKILTMSGTVFDLGDGGEQVYTFHVSTLENMKKELMLWLGMDTEHNNWNGLAVEDGMIVILDYQLAATETFLDKDYYKLVNGEYVKVDLAEEGFAVGDPIPKDTYYVEAQPYESAKIIFGDDMVKLIVSMIMSMMNTDAAPEADPEADPEPPAGADISTEKIGEYISTIKDFYENYLKGQVIDAVVDPEFALSAEITPDVVNEVINMINKTFKTKIKNIGNDPEYVKVHINEIDTDEEGNKVGVATKVTYITVKYDGKVYELTFDDSQDRTFDIKFKLTLESGRTYTFDFKAVRSEDRETWFVETKFDIADSEGTVENSTTVRLSDFHGKWGSDYAERLDGTEEEDGLLPDLTGAKPIFPAEDIPSVGNVLAQLIVDFINNKTVSGLIGQVGQMFLTE